MNTTWMIASGTFGNAVRQKILNVFLYVALALLVMFFAFAQFSPRQEMVIIKSMGLGIISLAGVFISVILGINLLPNEIERRTIYTVLSKPVKRYEFLLGKFFGGLMTVLANVALMSVLFIVVVTLKSMAHHEAFGQVDLDLFKGVLMIFFQLMLVCSLAFFFSVFLPPFVNFFLTFAVYLLGSTGILGTLATPSKEKNPITVAIFKFLYYVFPNFDNFNIQNPIIHPHIVIQNEGFYLTYIVLYAVLYSAVLMLLACAIFERREV